MNIFPLEPIDNSKRSYTQWKAMQIEKFEARFETYTKQDKGYPTRKDMESFATEIGVEVKAVRTRIINDRLKRKKKMITMKKKLNLPV